MRSLTGAVCIKLLTKLPIKGAPLPRSPAFALENLADDHLARRRNRLAGGRSSATHPNLDEALDSEALYSGEMRRSRKEISPNISCLPQPSAEEHRGGRRGPTQFLLYQARSLLRSARSGA
jgi:hypothetical protein